MKVKRFLYCCLGQCLLGTLWLAMSSAHAGPPVAGAAPIDPRQMSGIPRVDPSLAAGTITVRCLRGAFDAPAEGVVVTLEIDVAQPASDSSTSPKPEIRTATTDGQGRATFSELESFRGAYAIAKVTIDKQELHSQQIPIVAQSGSRVLLVADVAASSKSEHAQGKVQAPMPGEPFESARFSKGTIVVGVLDLAKNQAIADAEIRLKITLADAQEPIVRTQKTDQEGRAWFKNMLNEEFPAGTQFVAEVTLDGELQHSQAFTLKEQGVAVVFTHGHSTPDPTTVARRPLMPPQALPTLEAGIVRVTLVDANDQAVSNQEVIVQREEITGLQTTFNGFTGEDGIARIAIELADRALYTVTTSYQGAPFRSLPFAMDPQMGAGVELRVFSTTSDLSQIRGQVQFFFEPRENDHVQVTQMFQVFVAGEQAFWPGRPWQIKAAERAKGMVVLSQADFILNQPEKADYALVTQPIPPGEVIDLSIAYLLPHHGDAELDWTAPVAIVAGAAVLDPALQLTSGASGPPQRPPVEAGQETNHMQVDVYPLRSLAVGQSLELSVSGLPRRSPIFRWVGIGMIGMTLLGVLIGMMSYSRGRRRQRLLTKQAELLQTLQKIEMDKAKQSDEEHEYSELRAQQAKIVGELNSVVLALEALETA